MPYKTLKVKIGKKVVEKKGMDRSKIGLGQAAPPKRGEVEGQFWYWRYYGCPWCGANNWIYYDTVLYHWYRCFCCGRMFSA